MPDYQKAKIYTIRSHLTDQVYIGSTCKPLCDRMAHHRHAFKNNIGFCKSKILIEKGDAYIELIEAFPCNNKEELHKKEGEYIRNTQCVNKYIAGRKPEEYYQDNKDSKIEYSKNYYQDNKEKIVEYKKQYNKDNKEKMRNYMREYRKRLTTITPTD